MARSANKRQAKPPVASPKTNGPPPPAPPSTSTPPPPFTPAPTSLHPFLSTLPTEHIYLTHIDRTPSSLKRRVFLVPCLLNTIITLILLIRVYYAFPTYLQQIITIFGYSTPYTVDTSSESTASLLTTTFDRTFLIFLDYAIFALLGSWPREFLFGSTSSRYTSPVHWRYTLGFRDSEVIVRRGRKWDTPLLAPTDGEKPRLWTSDGLISLKYKTSPAMSPSYLSKTGYLLLDKDFDLDFRGILDAHRFAASSPPRLDLSEIDGFVFAYYNNQWLTWRPNVKPELNGTAPEDDKKVQAFKERLFALNCQGVFYRWIEIIQYETNQAGGFTQSKQQQALQELKKLIDAKGVTFAKFIDDMGGNNAIPGIGEDQ